MESLGMQPSDAMYENLCGTMVSNDSEDGVFYRIFFDSENRLCFMLRENNEQISGGTTGLSCWQVWSELASIFSDFSVLILGFSGYGGILQKSTSILRLWNFFFSWQND
jgi:hypothetical protein